MRWLLVILAISASLSAFFVRPISQGAVPPRDTASDILDQMTPEERIGQLFIVSFRGATMEDDSQVVELIRDYHVSGVILKAGNDNFVDAPETVRSARDLIASLQQAEYEHSQSGSLVDPSSGQVRPPTYVPLLVVASQEGDGPPYSEILTGLTTLPSQMAIGAAWDPELAGEIGQILGRELAAMGVNLLLGPSLDVLEDPRLVGRGELGVRTFGGDPYWVSVLGQAFIQGVHTGSADRIAVIAKHFPGLGGSDRPVEEEVASVRKSIGQLVAFEMVPFLAVTRSAPGGSRDIAEGLLTADIRYQGFQGNIRATTRPLSLDQGALQELMALETLARWREGGGVIVSGSLGSRALRRFVGSVGQAFVGHIVAKDAFLAGNDLLILSDFRSDVDPDEETTILSTLGFFAQKYREDAVFAQRVDEAALRILRLKLRLYGGRFAIQTVIPDPEALSVIGTGSDVAIRVARMAASQISPARAETEDRLGAPRLGQRIVFFTDSRTATQCTTCVERRGIPLDALETAVLRLYGQDAAGLVGSWNLSSYSMADLTNYLGVPPPAASRIALSPTEQVGEALRSADWLVFSILQSSATVYGSDALKRLLDEQPEIALDKRLVVFAHDVPYDLDATEISKIDLYIALYSKTPPFVEMAARLLFQELTAVGASPVSVPGVAYNLIEATSPDPEQVIQLNVVPNTADLPTATPAGYALGDLVRLETGVILDNNSHRVPDGTPVEFVLAYQGENIPSLEVSVTTSAGTARTEIALDRLGLLTITAQSPPARTSQIIQLNVQEGIPAAVTLIAPTPVPSPTLAPSPTAPAVTPTATPTAPGETQPTQSRDLDLSDLLTGLVGVMLTAGAGYADAARRGRSEQFKVRCALGAIVGGLLAYNYLALRLPGAVDAVRLLDSWAPLIAAALGGAAGVLGVLLVDRKGWGTSGR